MRTICVIGGALVCLACVPGQTGEASEETTDADVAPDAGPGGAILQRSPELGEAVEEAVDFAFAMARLDCDEGGAVLSLRLHDVEGCREGVERTNRIDLEVLEGLDLAAPLEAPFGLNVGPEAGAQALWVAPNGDRHEIAAGLLQLDAYDPEGEVRGRYLLVTEGGEELRGAFLTTMCANDACVVEPEVAPEGACAPRYEVDAWEADQAPFDPALLHDLLAAGVQDGRIDVEFAFAEDQLTWIDRLDGAPDPAVPPSPPMAFEVEAGNLLTEAGTSFTALPAADYPGAEPLVWQLHEFSISGRFTEDCRFVGRWGGAFEDLGYTIPGAPDADTDGDGVPDGYFVGGTIGAQAL